MGVVEYVAKYTMIIFSISSAAIGVVYWQGSALYLKFVTLLLIYVQVITLVQLVFRYFGLNNMPTLHAFSAGSFILIALIYEKWYEAPLPRILRASMLAYIGIHATLLIVGIEHLDQVNKYSEQVAAFAIAAITLYTVFTIADSNADVPLHKHPLFWISLGLFMLFPGNIFATAAIVRHYSFSLLTIYYTTATIGYCLISIGFLCLKWKN